MDAARWHALSPLLDRALDLAAGERDEWLAALRARDAAAATEIGAMLCEAEELSRRGYLESSPRVPGRRESPTGATGSAADGTGRGEVDETALAGRTFGAYTVERRLGYGGMGAVWLAHRSDGRFEAKVAIKLLNTALIGRVAERRFRREGEVLARLAHPHITRLLDAGVASDGQPYLVLEIVDGERIDRWCDERRLGIDARIRLFLEVLSAVEHAHAHLVVHRDIKPENVLVTREGVVKLLDFGIAKLLDDDVRVPGATALTREGARVLTPEYAAPEQLTGAPVTVATDVYALGVLLYTLLVGRHPAGDTARAPFDVIRSIVDAQASRASDAVTYNSASTRDEAEANAARRGLAPETLRQHLKGDLDAIVAKALEKDPHERYASATAFADDLRRHRADLPVLARPDVLRYRAVKFLRRNRITVALASLGIAATLAGLAGTIVQARHATEERDFALRQLSRVAATGDLDRFLIYDAAPSGRSFTAAELLARAEKIVAHATAEPAQTDLLIAIGRDYWSLDEAANAHRILARAYLLARATSDPSLRARAGCALAAALAGEGARGRVRAILAESLAALPSDARYDYDRIDCEVSASSALRAVGDAAAAVRHAQKARALASRLPVPSPVLEESTWEAAAESYRAAGELAMADAGFEVANRKLEALGRGDTQAAGTLLNNWGVTLIQMGQPLRAEPMLRRAIEIMRSGGAYDGVSPMLLANYAHVLDDLGRDRDAIRYVTQAQGIASANHAEVITNMTLVQEARIRLSLGDLDGATHALDEVEPRLRNALPPGHYAFASIASERSMIALAGHDDATALANANRALALAGARPENAVILPSLFTRRSAIELAGGMRANAEADAKRALAALSPDLTRGRPSLAAGRAWLALGRAQSARGEEQEAARSLARAEAQLRDTVGAGHPETRLAAALAAQAAPAVQGTPAAPGTQASQATNR